MTAYHGGQTVGGGLYLKVSTWDLESIASEGGVLTGDKETRYSRVPLPVVLVGGPLAGLAYVIFVPIGFWFAFGSLLARRVGRGIRIIGRRTKVAR